MNEKITFLQKHMIAENIDMVYLDNPNTVAYFTRFESNPHERIVALIVTQSDDFLFIPTLEKEEAAARSTIEKIYTYDDEENPWEIIGQETYQLVNKINNINMDETTLTVERQSKLLQALLNTQKADSTISSGDISSLINQMRVVKSADEIDKMLVAGQLADEALKIGMDALVEGVTEQEVAALIDMEMKKRGVSEMSFSTLVLFGDHAASPHGSSGNRQLKQNELVLFDLGVIFNGYASDVTRTVAFGSVSKPDQEVYHVVLKAYQAAKDAAKPGMRAGELDQIARKVIDDAGYGKYFTHRLGHGIGKTAHEFPSIHGSNETILEPGMAFSIEPGIYIPGEVGVRIEDCVYITDDGSEPFTFFDKKFSILPVK